MSHVHHWKIASPDGRVELPGKCRCGEKRMFKASNRDANEWRGVGWNEQITHTRKQQKKTLSDEMEVEA